MRNIEKLRRALRTEYFTSAEIITVLGADRHLPSAVSRMVDAGEIIRVRNGLFVFGPSFQTKELNLFTVANMLFGPSYVSLESALSYYGLIPEDTKTVTSITWKRTKQLQTPVGNYLYRRITLPAFSVGVSWLSTTNAHFLISCPEKAILDKLYLDPPSTDAITFLTQSLRMELHDLRMLKIKQLTTLAPLYDNARLVNRAMALAKALS